MDDWKMETVFPYEINGVILTPNGKGYGVRYKRVSDIPAVFFKELIKKAGKQIINIPEMTA